ncbi:MAG TPA: energy transducer TonB [Rhizomicrobium sp.]|nr:energy transducer TonB [Rhizomicrobium sp.]
MKNLMVASLALCLGSTSAFGEAANAPPQKYEIGRLHHCEEYFPKDLQRQGAEGDTTLSFVVTTEGRTKNIRVAQSSGNKGLDWAAEVCAEHWKYKPARKDGVPIDTPWKAKIVWTVPSDPASDGATAPGQPSNPSKP